MGFQSTHRAMSDEEFRRAFLAFTEKEWEVMPAQHLTFLGQEVERRGLGPNLKEAIGEVTLPHVRWARQRVENARPALQSLRSVGEAMGLIPSKEDNDDRLTLMRLANDPRFPTMSEDMIDTVMSLPPEKRATFINGYRELQTTGTGQSLPEASTESGATYTDEETALDAALAKPTDQPSSETSRGAATTAESGYDLVAYRRLPLVAKRDAFLDNGFLYVRTAVLKEWIRRLTSGRCCRPQQERLDHHSSDCWLRDAVR